MLVRKDQRFLVRYSDKLAGFLLKSGVRTDREWQREQLLLRLQEREANIVFGVFVPGYQKTTLNPVEIAIATSTTEELHGR